MTEFEKAFLAKLASCPQGRMGFDPKQYNHYRTYVCRLVEEGYIRERRFGHELGFQIQFKGREYLGGSHD